MRTSHFQSVVFYYEERRRISYEFFRVKDLQEVIHKHIQPKDMSNRASSVIMFTSINIKLNSNWIYCYARSKGHPPPLPGRLGHNSYETTKGLLPAIIKLCSKPNNSNSIFPMFGSKLQHRFYDSFYILLTCLRHGQRRRVY